MSKKILFCLFSLTILCPLFAGQITPTTIVTTKHNHNLYAWWDINTYNITWNNNGGSGTEGGSSSVEYGHCPSLPTTNPTKTGYEFKNWNTKSDGSGDTITSGTVLFPTKVNDNLVIYANYSPNTYYVRFNKNNGEGSMDDEAFTYDLQQELRPNTFTRIGFTFSKWATSPGGSTTTYSDEQSVKNLTSEKNGIFNLYAMWNIAYHSLTWDLDNGTILTSGTPAGSVAYGTALTAPIVEKEGYVFNSWTPAVPATMPDTDVKFTALWNAHKTIVYFTYNGATGNNSIASKEVYYDSPYGTLPSPTKTNYTFAGWYTE